MAVIEQRVGEHLYRVTTPNNFVVIFRDGKPQGVIRLESPAEPLKFFDNMVICRLPALPEKSVYSIHKRRIELKDNITEKFGDLRLLELLDRDPPVFLYNSPRSEGYRGLQWVILSYSTVPIGHFTLVS